MEDPKIPREPLFPWGRDGIGLHVSDQGTRLMSHEVLFEDEFTSLKEKPLFLGRAVPKQRFIYALVLVLGLVGLLAGRAVWMQIVDGASYRERAERNRLRRDVIPPRRGIIRDSTGKVLAENTPAFDLTVIPWLLPRDAPTRDELLGKVGREVGMPLDAMQALIASSTDPTETLVLKRDIRYEQAIGANILLGDDPALRVVTGSKRFYPESPLVQSLSHVLGYVGSISPTELTAHVADAYRQTDLIGKTGIEASYEKVLRGVPGERLYEVDAHNSVTSVVGDQAPIDGHDLTLSIDLALQKAAEDALQKELTSQHLTRGSVVAIDPRDGAIRAIVSIPAYDNNLFSGTVSSTAYAALLNNPDHPLLPRAWAGVYPSGSTVKPAIATAALAEGVITANTTVNSTGGIRIGTSFFPDWKPGGHGITNVRKAIAWSVNSFFYTVGGGYESFIGLGIDRLGDWLKRFGLGSRTGLDIPAENMGFVPSKEWKEKTKGERWYVGDTYNVSIGQGDLLVTPVQVAEWTATIANGGYRVQPHVGFQVDDGSGQETVTGTRATDPVASADIIKTVRLGMRDCVIYGSGRALSTLPFPVAGKTGTAQWRNDKPNHAWFTSFAPFDNPEIVVTVLLEEGGEGSSTAIPVARDVLTAWYAGRKL